eukprot:TRINITY_DN58411_c0_g1_i1.p1 TRINITY_DN58411_c0_g1~~TRINITY_DN58411_c0_g1_i1.p1  ORF type:complete len:238 (+),score=21.50 TRINITY_DN58411_c0_g1_i1:52-714(+)
MAAWATESELYPEPRQEDILLAHAVRNGHARDAVALIDKDGANVNARLPDGATPLTLCCRSDEHDPITLKLDLHENQRLYLAKRLCERRADINVKGPCGWTPLMLACFYGQANLAKFLLEEKADVNYEDASGRDAMSLTRYSEPFNLRSITNALYDCGADPPLDILLKRGLVPCDVWAPIEMDGHAERLLRTNVTRTSIRASNSSASRDGAPRSGPGDQT